MTMRRIDLQPLEPFTSDFIDRTGAFNPGALEAATAIIEQVRQEDDGALRALTEKFDGVAIENFRVPPEAIDAAMAEVDPDTLEALRHAAAQIRDFHPRGSLHLEVHTVAHADHRPAEQPFLAIEFHRCVIAPVGQHVAHSSSSPWRNLTAARTAPRDISSDGCGACMMSMRPSRAR